jgi:hypothetical protein
VLVLVTANAIAGTGVGGVFNLGQTNTVDAQTILNGNPGGNAQLRVQNTSGGSGAFGVLGRTTTGHPSTQSAGLRGINEAVNGAGYGVWGTHHASGVGVFGSAPTGTGVLGTNTGSGFAGVSGSSTGADGTGVVGAADTGGSAYGVWGHSASGYGVVGEGASNGGLFIGGTDGINTGTSGTNFSALFAHHDGTNSGYGVYASTGVGIGVQGAHSNGNYGFLGSSSDGVHGFSGTVDGNGAVGEVTGGNVPLRSLGPGPASGYAGYFDGDVYVAGSLSVAGTKNFRIDDPQDPTGHYLVHAAVESPAPTNVYSGNVTTDANGNATVDLPSYFSSINANFRYQLTVVGRSPRRSSPARSPETRSGSRPTSRNVRCPGR